MRLNCQRILSIATCLSVLVFAHAQDGVSTAGAARARYLGNLGVIPASREVTVEDFINYHRHEIGRPKAGEAVGLDVRWGSESVTTGGEAILQVGLSTALAHDRQELRPLNLALVIDHSGSMADANKLTRVKAAMTTLVSQLRPTDMLSIVVFDSKAEVLFPAQPVRNASEVNELIRQIKPGSATNLNAGLMLGYEEATKHRAKGTTSRVILLTDGIANQGVIDPNQIAHESKGFNDQGIDLSTIGVGLDLNKDLLKKLAKSGRGLFHFVADSEDIQKVFVKELQSQISPIATEPSVEIDAGFGLQLEKVYGYEPRTVENSTKVKLDNMNSGMTEVVLLRFQTDSSLREQSKIPVTVRLSYYDLDRKKRVETTQKAFVTVAEGPRKESLEDGTVQKNYSIALLAQSIRDMAAACEAHRYRKAESLVNGAIEKTSQRYPNLEDEDIKRTLAIAQKYQDALHKQNLASDTSEPSDDVTPSANLVANGDFALGNWGFQSPALSYSAPGENCLWAMGYTVAPRFNSPLLHRLVPAEEYAAPKQPNGNEQTMYANVGGTDTLVVWTSQVKCKPNTTYRLSFQGISLSPGREWIPTFEIRVNGERSEPQPAGANAYAGISWRWESKGATTATISIVRMPIMHGGGVIGIANIEMVPVLRGHRNER